MNGNLQDMMLARPCLVAIATAPCAHVQDLYIAICAGGASGQSLGCCSHVMRMGLLCCNGFQKRSGMLRMMIYQCIRHTHLDVSLLTTAPLLYTSKRARTCNRASDHAQLVVGESTMCLSFCDKVRDTEQIKAERKECNMLD